jgi:hypothetical protein
MLVVHLVYMMVDMSVEMMDKKKVVMLVDKMVVYLVVM